MDTPCGATRAGTQAPPLPISTIFFHASHTNKITIYTQFTPTTSTVSCVIYPNKTVGAVPMCPPERPRSGVSIPKIHALCAGDERWMRPCGATRAGTQAPPLPNSVIHPHTILPNDINHPNETRKQSTHTSGAEMHRALPPPFFKTSCVCKLASR